MIDDGVNDVFKDFIVVCVNLENGLVECCFVNMYGVNGYFVFFVYSGVLKMLFWIDCMKLDLGKLCMMMLMEFVEIF